MLIFFSSWSDIWQLSVASQKCVSISFGNPNIPSLQCSIGSVPLQSVTSICDLGVHLSSDLKPHIHCSYVAAKAFGRCSVLLKGFISNDPHLLVLAYKIYVRPILEYNSPIWSPWLISDIKCIERVQRNVSSLGLYGNVLVFQNLVILIGFITLASNHLNIAEYFLSLVLQDCVSDC